MPIARFQMPDGRIARFEVPEGTTPEQLSSFPSTGASQKSFEPVKVGADAFPDVLRETLKGTDWGTRNIAAAGQAVENMWEGLKDAFGKGDKANIQANQVFAQEAPVGTLVGTAAAVAPMALLPGANTVAGGAAYGALQGAILTPGDLKARAISGGLGAAGGALGSGIAKATGASSPITTNPNAAILAGEGIRLTPGQNAGGWLKALEDKATSIPFVGDIIQGARKKGIEDFNRAALERATLPGGVVNEIGHQGVQDARQALGQAYDQVLAKSSANAMEPQFIQNMANLRALVSNLPQREQRAFDGIIAREFDDGTRVAPNGLINAENLQAVKRGLDAAVDRFSKSNDAYQSELGQALKQARQEFLDLIARSNPQNAQELATVNKAYANFKRIQRAASSVANPDGVFTPAQLNNAVKALDKSKDKRAFSEGTALMQDLTGPAKQVMPSSIPDSGTAGRTLANVLNPINWPGMALSGAASVPVSLAYSQPGMRAINALYNRGGVPMVNALRELLSNNRLTLPGALTATKAAQLGQSEFVR